MAKTLINNSVFTIPAVSAKPQVNADAGSLQVQIDEEKDRIIATVNICYDDGGTTRRATTHKAYQLTQAEYDSLATERDAFLDKVWDILKTNSLVDF